MNHTFKATVKRIELLDNDFVLATMCPNEITGGRFSVVEIQVEMPTPGPPIGATVTVAISWDAHRLASAPPEDPALDW